VGKLGYGSSVGDLVKDLNALWEKLNKGEFDTYLLEFLNKWNARMPSYCSYFRSTWLELHPPKDWTKHERRSSARSGNTTFAIISGFTV